MSWTDERIERLRKLWQDGLSASQIAAELGNVTRNAVIGKVHRLGLSGRAKTASVTPAQRPRQKTAVRTPRAPAPVVARGNLAVAEAVEMVPVVQPLQARADVVIAIARRVSIMELREGLCRWPLGDPLLADFAFCGADCAGGKVYCTHHARVAFQPAMERRRS